MRNCKRFWRLGFCSHRRNKGQRLAKIYTWPLMEILV